MRWKTCMGKRWPGGRTGALYAGWCTTGSKDAVAKEAEWAGSGWLCWRGGRVKCGRLEGGKRCCAEITCRRLLVRARIVAVAQG
jgi:hypothetical protein